MRLALPLILLLASLATAAPVPIDKVAEKKQLEALWDVLCSADEVVRTKAVFALLDHPRAVEFLAVKLPPVDATREQLAGWLKDLNSDDEKVWRPAFERLQYVDPRISLSIEEQVGAATTGSGKWRLASIWAGGMIELPPNVRTIMLSAEPNGVGGRYLNFSVTTPTMGKGWGLGSGVVSEISPPTWQRAAVAAHLLHCVDTKASRAVLERLATGHPDALPTRTATTLLKTKRPTVVTEKQFTAAWESLITGDIYAYPGTLFALATAPDAVSKLKAELPAITATRGQITAWVKALDDPDEKKWKPAFDKLRLCRPQLALTAKEQCELVNTDRGRWAVYLLAGVATQRPDEIDFGTNSVLEPNGDEGFTIRYDTRNGGQGQGRCDAGPLEKWSPPHWQRARLAVILLERIKTADAKAVLKQLADGHPDILPTKEAKAALERLTK